MKFHLRDNNHIRVKANLFWHKLGLSDTGGKPKIVIQKRFAFTSFKFYLLLVLIFNLKYYSRFLLLYVFSLFFLLFFFFHKKKRRKKKKKKKIQIKSDSGGFELGRTYM